MNIHIRILFWNLNSCWCRIWHWWCGWRPSKSTSCSCQIDASQRSCSEGHCFKGPSSKGFLLQRRSRQHRLGKKWKVKQLLKRSCRVKWLAALLRFLLLSLLQSQPQAKLQSRAHLAKRVVLKCTGLRASQHWSWVQWSRFKMKSCQIGRKRKNLLLVQRKPLLSKCPHRLGCFQPMSPRWSMRSCLANTLMEMLVPWQTWGSGPTMFQGHLWHGYWNGRTRTILCLSLGSLITMKTGAARLRWWPPLPEMLWFQPRSWSSKMSSCRKSLRRPVQ